MAVLCVILQAYVFVVLARLVLSWVSIPPEGVLASAYQVVFAVTEPPLSAIRTVVPVVRMGASGLDLSPVILIIGISLLTSFLTR